MYSPLRFIPSIFLKRSPLHLTVFVTAKCNASCKFCFYLRARVPVGKPADREELTLDEIERVSASTGNLLWLSFSGGEVFLRDDIVEISRAFYRNNRPSIMLYSTNGLLPEQIETKMSEIVRSCPKSVIAVKVSLDGIGQCHDESRGVVGAFDRTMRTIELLGRLSARYGNLELGINTVFSAQSENAISETMRFVKDMPNVRTHTISLIRGELEEQALKGIDPQLYRLAIRDMEESLRSGVMPIYRMRFGRIKAAQDIVQRRIIHRTITESRRIIPCYAGRLNVVLTEAGDVYPCESFDGRHLLGNVRQSGYDLGGVLGTERAREIVRGIGRECFCTHECYLMTNILFNPRQYPRLLSEAFSIRR